MEQLDSRLEQALENWRNGRSSLEELRALSRNLGNKHYSPGIPTLMRLLDHEDEIVRYNAASALGFELHHKPAVGKLLTMLSGDSDEDCRRVAAGALGNLCQDKKDQRVLRTLSQAALNDPDEYVRSSAYKALLSVNGLSREEHLRQLRDQSLAVDKACVDAIIKEISE